MHSGRGTTMTLHLFRNIDYAEDRAALLRGADHIGVSVWRQ
jgi:hypothetical protein